MSRIKGLATVFRDRLEGWRKLPLSLERAAADLGDLRELAVLEQICKSYRHSSNPVARCGAKCFSQSDEDGITLEIIRRLEIGPAGTFVEFGVGNGLENNTLVLRSLGWNGCWIGGEDLAFTLPPQCRGFTFVREWITSENVVRLFRAAQDSLGANNVDLLSVDLDGNDYHLVKELLECGLRPRVMILEYNAKFPPPVEWVMPYNSAHVWEGDDFFGASLASWVKLLQAQGYRLICCNIATGANCFFVHNDDAGAFGDVPDDPRSNYVPPRYRLLSKFGHKATPRLVRHLLQGGVA